MQEVCSYLRIWWANFYLFATESSCLMWFRDQEQRHKYRSENLVPNYAFWALFLKNVPRSIHRFESALAHAAALVQYC
jgi:hypothetical protein